jgi:hypothetical protein
LHHGSIAKGMDKHLYIEAYAFLIEGTKCRGLFLSMAQSALNDKTGGDI